MAKRSPPIPFIIGETTPIIAFVAIAASTAFPPRSRIRAPACAASGDSAATIPCREITIERAWDRSCACVWGDKMPPATATTKTEKRNIGLTRSPSVGRIQNIHCATVRGRRRKWFKGAERNRRKESRIFLWSRQLHRQGSSLQKASKYRRGVL